MAGDRSYYITTPIYYVNDSPHIGHAYTTLACDVMARFKRLDGYDVMFLTGTDEHGQKVEKSARDAGVEPLAFCDRVSQRFRDLAAVMNYSNDDFIRTTEERHRISVQALWTRLKDAGEIYLDSYAGWYSVRDEAFYAESELIAGPDGGKLAPTGAPVEWVEEPSYFFRLSQWQDRLLELYAANPDMILPEGRRNEVVSFVKGGLQDLSVSRTSFKWGIPVPGDDDHIMYVWLDALTNYITAVGFPDENAPSFKEFWPADVHMVGKDILRFHAVYWPAFLMAASVAPPKRIYAHGWWTNEGQKISKSLGNVIAPHEIVADYGLDQVRYFLLREVPFGNDGDFSHSAMVHRINGDLANDFGNLAQRVLSMVAKNCAGQVPEPGEPAEADCALLSAAGALLDDVRRHLDVQAFHLALGAIWKVVGEANRYVDEQAPWALRKTDPARMATVLHTLCETIRRLALLTQAFMPEASARMLDQLAVAADDRGLAAIGDRHMLKPGTALPRPQPVFPRYVEAEEGGGLMLVDSHCHLDFPDFADDLDQVVERAHEAGVGVMQTICTRLTKFDQVRDLAERYDDIWCSVGVHPHNVESEGIAEPEALVALAAHPKVIGIGETGLDYFYDHSPRDDKRQSFRNHIAAARETGLPLIVHTRDADADTMAILEDEMGKGAFAGLIHCFSTSRELAERSLAIGLSISISGIVTFSKAQELREIAADIPLERLLVETDAPYLAPVPHRGKRNEPSYVQNTAALLAELKAVSEHELADITTDNFFKLFTKATRPTG